MSWPEVFWDTYEHASDLEHECIGDAVGDYLDGEPPAEWPEWLTVYRFLQDEIGRDFIEREVESICDGLIESLDMRYGCGDEPSPPVDDTVRELVLRAVETAASRFDVWACHNAGSVDVNVAEWVCRNEPRWLVEDGSDLVWRALSRHSAMTADLQEEAEVGAREYVASVRHFYLEGCQSLLRLEADLLALNHLNATAQANALERDLDREWPT